MEDNSPEYTSVLLQYFEEEIMGEAYFESLAEYFDETHQKEKLVLLAKVERRAAESVRPLLEKYKLKPRSDIELHQIGLGWSENSKRHDWNNFVADMSERYVSYVDMFHALERMAPRSDLAALKILTDHEVAAIDFANLEIAGDADSAAPLRKYLQPVSD